MINQTLGNINMTYFTCYMNRSVPLKYRFILYNQSQSIFTSLSSHSRSQLWSIRNLATSTCPPSHAIWIGLFFWNINLFLYNQSQSIFTHSSSHSISHLWSIRNLAISTCPPLIAKWIGLFPWNTDLSFIINLNQYLHIYLHIQDHSCDQSETWQYQNVLPWLPNESVSSSELPIYSFIINPHQYLPIHFHIQYHICDQAETWQYQHVLSWLPNESVCPAIKQINSTTNSPLIQQSYF